MSKDDVIAAVRECARKLGHTPSLTELERLSGVTHGKLRTHFLGHREAIRAAGLAPSRGGRRIATRALLMDWAAMARKLGKLPSRNYYRRHGQYSATSLSLRFGAWALVSVHFLNFCRENGLEAQWQDVLRLAGDKLRLSRTDNSFQPAAPLPQKAENGLAAAHEHTPLPLAPPRALLPGRPVTGGPLSLFLPGLAHEPANEAGVVFVFGMMAHHLGFRVLSLQTVFPDCEAMRAVQPGKWQRVRIEFEFASRNFKEHGHDPELCDVIVCWVHNWPECPLNLEVVELSRVVRTLESPTSP